MSKYDAANYLSDKIKELELKVRLYERGRFDAWDEVKKYRLRAELAEAKLAFIDEKLRTSILTYSNKILDQAKTIK